jgi:hypothetical protein
LKSCVLQKSTQGIKGYQFASINVPPKSALMLAGFWRVTNADLDNVEIISVGTAQHSFLTALSDHH